MFRIFKSKIAISALVLVIIAGGGYLFFAKRAPKYQFVSVQSGPISETVSVTGNTVPTKSVSLAFGTSGIISKTYADLGEEVHAGEVLAELNMGDLLASLHQAQANVAQQQAKLQSLQTSSQPSDASNVFITAMQNTYLQTENALVKYADTLFTSGSSVNPDIIIRTQDQTEKQSIENDRLITGENLKKWKDALASINTSSDTESINSAGIVAQNTIASVVNFFGRLGTITGNLTPGNSGLTQSQIDTYKEDINTGAQAVSTASATEQDAYSTWGSAPQNIDAQEAAVQAAEATVESAQAKIQNAQIIAPISGTITQFDAKVGELASLTTPLVSINSDAGYEVDAGVSETDIGKITAGNPVTMTLDAFPNETFSGSVFYIAPAETNTQGVVNYQIKISFDKPDPRLKSGLTANIDIQTKHKDNVLILPQYAILQNDNGIFVETLEGKTVKQNPVTLGIQDDKGNVEILSGVTPGEKVLNIGLKTK